MARRGLVEVAALLLWLVGGTFGMLAIVPDASATVAVGPRGAEADFFRALNDYRSARGSLPLTYDHRVEEIVSGFDGGTEDVILLLQRRWALCQSSNWLTVSAQKGTPGLVALQGIASRYLASLALDSHYTHVGIGAHAEPESSRVLYRALLCRPEESSAP